MMSKDVYQLVKETFCNKICLPDYPELALYENFLKLNAQHWFNPKNCNVGDCYNFGRSVIPAIYDDKVHEGLILIEYRNGIQHGKTKYLKYKIYLHDLLIKIWNGEMEGYKVTFEIVCIGKSDENVKIN